MEHRRKLGVEAAARVDLGLVADRQDELEDVGRSTTNR
jgi:hypothetical protein